MSSPSKGFCAMCMLVKNGVSAGNIGEHEFRVLPRAGEFLMRNDAQGHAQLYEVLQVHYSTESGGIDLWIEHKGPGLGYYNTPA